jgi:hypothetical protein
MRGSLPQIRRLRVRRSPCAVNVVWPRLAICGALVLTCAAGFHLFLTQLIAALSPAVCHMARDFDGLAPLLEVKRQLRVPVSAARQPPPAAAPPSVFLFPLSGMWEGDWLESLGIRPDINAVELVQPDAWPASVVLVASVSVEHEPFVSALRSFHVAIARGVITSFGLVHLSDETGLLSPTQSNVSALYGAPQCRWVLRNYWVPGAPAHVHYFPLGFKVGFAAAVDAALAMQNATRDLAWGFAGSVKQGRGVFSLDALKGVTPLRSHWIAEWGSAASLTTTDYALTLTRSTFAPCPPGNVNADTFRVSEALEAGAIPVVLRAGAASSLHCRPPATGMQPSARGTPPSSCRHGTPQATRCARCCVTPRHYGEPRQRSSGGGRRPRACCRTKYPACEPSWQPQSCERAAAAASRRSLPRANSGPPAASAAASRSCVRRLRFGARAPLVTRLRGLSD